MKIIVPSILFAALVTGAAGKGTEFPAIIPLPELAVSRDGTFALDGNTRIVSDPASEATGVYLAAWLRHATGLPLPSSVNAAPAGSRAILLCIRGADPSLGDEGYELSVSADGVVIRAPSESGLFHGVQSLLQLLPPEAFAQQPVLRKVWTIPCIGIKDRPRFAWRGMMLDAGRHFVGTEEVKRLLDVMALHKLNVLQWHLTEDQGWRIQIRRYPRLTEVGAWRDSSPPYGDREGSDGRRYGGFYTQEQVRDVVAYAAALHITVVPEIEMPGHSAAAIAAYPQLGNDDVPGYAPRVATHWGVHPYTYAPKEETFRFLEDVLTEVCSLFPSRFIHIGGDEAPKTQWRESGFAQGVMKREGLRNEDELQSWFIRRIERFLESKGRRLVGWDEINEGGLPAAATVMVWRDAKWANHAIALGHDVIMATETDTYFNEYQFPAAIELARGPEFEAQPGLLPLAKAYAYDPVVAAGNPVQAGHVLGTQGQLWTEYIRDPEKLEYMAFPRLIALSEVAWTPQSGRNLDDFIRRLQPDLQRLRALGIAYHP